MDDYWSPGQQVGVTNYTEMLPDTPDAGRHQVPGHPEDLREGQYSSGDYEEDQGEVSQTLFYLANVSS